MTTFTVDWPGETHYPCAMTDTHSDTPTPTLDAAAEGLTLPPGIELLEKLGSGRAGSVFKAHYQGEVIALKAYKASAADWYKKKIGKNVAIYEMMQNREFRKHKELVDYTAKPLRVIGQDGSCSLCFLQEYVDGLTLEELGEQLGQFPGYLMRTGESIARTCEEKSLDGVDEFMKGVKFRQASNKNWSPVMFDFKHVPSASGKNAGPGLLQRLGLNRGGQGPKGFLGDWQALSDRLDKK